MYEELLHEVYIAFLRVGEESIIKYSTDLKPIGLMLIKSLYNSRNEKRVKRNVKGLQTYNPLNEIKGIDASAFYSLGQEDETFEDDLERRNKERKLDTMNELLNSNRDNEKVQLLVICYNEGVSKVAKDMGTNRQKIYNDLKGIKETLKECIK
jgi:hypothetical protein